MVSARGSRLGDVVNQMMGEGPRMITDTRTNEPHVAAVGGPLVEVLGGPGGAAARLGLKRTTLQSRMRKLGIERPRV